MPERQPEKIRVMGMDVVLNNIGNRHIRRAIDKRGGFLHYSAEGVRIATGHNEHTDVTRHTDEIASAYDERSTHTDDTPKAKRERNKTMHLDGNRHTDDTHYDDTDSDALGWGGS